ncbi:ATP-dependent RNA helicase DHX33 [Lycorma delicatula]|uniref:ATP-dependent RNA helicase DHX33 n=1 Tax=Lycorma delicatula TaxID=130591 RepID=UPI003F513076
MSNYSEIKHKLGLAIKRPAAQIFFNINSSPKKSNVENKLQDKSYSISAILQQRKLLPVYKVKRRLLEEVDKHSSLIIIGETGSGKTTQIPHFIHDLKLEGSKMIGVTQPRRVAAVTVAQRVAQEMDVVVGSTVGYCVRFEDCTSSSTKLKYLTDGMLLREAMLDEYLMGYNVIVLDEAHERTIHTDVLFGIVKKAQAYRLLHHLSPLKVLIMSATMDVDHFSKYFNNASIVYLEGRQYPVEVFHAVEPQDDYCFSCLVTIFQIHKDAPANEDILVFLTGQEEIESMSSSIRSILKDPQCSGPPMKVYPLYAALNTSRQLDVFRPAPAGTRKVILSTNIAETSVTISGIKYVIDSGMVKARTHHAGTGLDVLRVQSVSQAQAWQRTGRAGRESAGFCYRVYTKLEFAGMLKNTIPEIQRCSLSSVVLQLLAININPLNFDFLDKPPKESVVEAINLLHQLGAVECVENPHLTALGKKMSQFPLDPRFSKIILSASDFGCLEEVLSIVSLLSVESVFVSAPAKKEEAAAARQKFLSSSGDLITLLNIYRCFNNMKNKKKWCFDNFMNSWNMEYASEVRTQLTELCRNNNLVISSCGNNMERVRKVFLTGLFMNLAELQRDKSYVTVGSSQRVCIHPSSAVFGSLPPCVLYAELVQTNRVYMKHVSPIDPDWLEEVMPNYARLHPHRKHPSQD